MTPFSAIQLYVGLLRLYPPAFRTQFGDEMAGVFESALVDAGRQGMGSLLAFWLHEVFTLIPAALSEHRREWRRTRHTPEAAARFDLVAARWIARVVSLLICSILLDGFGTLTGPLDSPLQIIQILGLVGLLLAWRWEELGGLLVVAAGVLSGATIMSAVMVIVGAELLGVWLLSGLVWAVPYLVFGLLFIKIGRHQRRLQGQRPGSA